MRAVLIYSLVLIAALTGMFAQQLGWRPPSVAPWDLQAGLASILGLALVAFIAGVALSGTLQFDFLPNRLRQIPNITIVLFVNIVISVAVSMHVTTVGEIEELFEISLIVSIIGGVLIGVISDPLRESDIKQPIAMNRIIGTIIIISIITVIIVEWPRRPSNGSFENCGEFQSKGVVLRVGVSRLPFSLASFGTLAIDQGMHSNNLVLEVSEVKRIRSLLAKAAEARGHTWHLIGSVRETDLANAATLTVTSGETVHLAITQEKHGEPVSFDLPERGDASVDQSLACVIDKLR